MTTRDVRKKSWLMATPLRAVLDLAMRLPGRDAIKAVTDVALIIISASWAWFVSFGQVAHPGNPLPFVLMVVVSHSIVYFALRLHRTSWLHVSRHEVIRLAASAALAAPLILIFNRILFLPLRGLVRPHLILATEPAFYLVLLCGARITARAVASTSRQGGRRLRRVLIAGAGATGRALAFQVQDSSSDYEIVGFVDDDPRKVGRHIRGLPVLGGTAGLERLLAEYEVQELAVAIADIKPDLLRRLMQGCEPLGISVRILPPLRELMGNKPDLRSLREVQMEDLLPRPEVQLDREGISRYLRRRTILVTGGGGSIGGELCRQVLKAGADRLLVLGRGENSVFEMLQELSEQENSCELIPVICDVRDRAALKQIYSQYHLDAVFHAAAHKHVPLMEQYPCEAVKNNVLGTLNMVELAVENQVEHFVLVSTDKAVDPSSVMGATKRIGEMIVKGYAAQSGANMVSVRFGNVLGSRGSVVPTMTRQIRRGLPVTVTDPDMVRYFMTIPEAVQLILQAGAVGGCGEVFILDMGRPVRILDLAHDLIRLHGLVPNKDIPIRIIGRRPGEKMKEDLVTTLESTHTEKNGLLYMAPSPAVDLSDLLLHIEELGAASKQGAATRVVELIQQIVPEFNPDRETVATVGGTNGTPANGSSNGVVRVPLKRLNDVPKPGKPLSAEVAT